MDIKTTKRRLYFVLVLAVISIGLGTAIFLSASRADNHSLPESREIFTLYDTYNMTVIVAFDEEPPTVQLITPDNGLVDMKDIRYKLDNNFIQYFLPNATPGTWHMAYDPLSNTEISTHYSVYMAHIFINNFSMKIADVKNNEIPLSFEVSSDKSGEFRYELYAVFMELDNGIVGERLLVQGYGALNELIALAVFIDEHNAESGFMLRLSASVQHGQAAIMDTAWLDLR